MKDFEVSDDPENGDLLLSPVGGEEIVRPQSQDDHFQNLLGGVLSDSVADALCPIITQLVDEDDRARSKAIEIAKDALELLGIGGESKPDDVEYEQADRSDSQLLLTAHTRFQTKATAAILPQPKKVCIAEANEDISQIKDPVERKRKKDELDAIKRRVEDFYTDYLFNRAQPYQEDTDSIIFDCGLHGTGFRKIYTDRSRSANKVRVEYVPFQDLIVAPRDRRYTHRMMMKTSDLIRRIQRGVYLSDSKVSASALVGVDELTRAASEVMGVDLSDGNISGHQIDETYLDLVLEGDEHPEGLARPYVVTIHRTSQKILSIVRDWQPRDNEEKPIDAFSPYVYAPGPSGRMGIGLGHILGNTTRAVRTGQRRAFEAAYLQNLPFGYIASSMSIRDGSSKITPGTLRTIDSPTEDISKAIQINKFDGPSPGLMTLIDRVEANGKELGGIATIDFSQMMRAGVTAAPAIAALEESTEFQTSIHRRLYDANAMEMKLLHDRMQEAYGNQVITYGNGRMLHAGDLLAVDLLPVMKPGYVSKQKALMEAQLLMEAADKAPDVINKRAAVIEYVKSLGRSDIDDFILPDPSESPPEPADPVTEYMAVLMGKPVTSGLAQNHAAHIDAHNSQMRIIETSQMPVEDGQRAMAMLAAHIVEHHAQMMLVDVATRIGIDPSVLASGVPPEIEAQVSGRIAEATRQVEEDRRPQEGGGDDGIMREMIKTDRDLKMLGMKQEHEIKLADIKARYDSQLQKQKDDAEMDRAQQDDATALAIEAQNRKNGGNARPRAGTITT